MVRLDPAIHAQYANLAKAFRGSSPRTLGSAGVAFTARMNQVTIKKAFTEERRFNRELSKVLHKFGAYVRKTAKQSMRYRKKKVLDGRFVRRVSISYAARVQKEVQMELFTPRGKVDLPFYRYPSSKPGEPPFAHTNPLLRKLIQYEVDHADLSVRIGPLPAAQKIAELQEYGGSVMRTVAVKPNEFGQLIISGFKGDMKRQLVRYPHRPYMRPAFWKSMDFLQTVLLPSADLSQGLKNTIVQRASSSVNSYQGQMFQEAVGG